MTDSEVLQVVDTLLTPSEVELNFSDVGLDQKIIDIAQNIGWTKPTPVQGMCLPLTTAGRDVAGFAQTGTGKTGVFVLTVAQKLLHAEPSSAGHVCTPEVVVLTPTRELAMQIDDDAKRILAPLGMNSMAVFGGVDFDKQAGQLKAKPRVIVATPGRLKDFFQRKMIDLNGVTTFICDEADRMFDMGFIDDVEFFLDKIPENAQKLLFSATTNDNVKELAFEYLNNPSYVSVTPETMTPERIEQHAIICDSSNKLRVMIGLLKEHNPECAIIFVNTKMVADWLQYKLEGNGIEVDIITGDLPQRKRISLIQRIKLGQVKALIATDVASRGLHISKVSHVYNFDVPEDPSNYVHRIGRTARAGLSGKSYTLVCEDYGEHMIAVNEMLGAQIAPKSEWFNPDYLNIKDQTGNPYVVGGPLYRDPKDRDDRKHGASAFGASKHGRTAGHSGGPKGEKRFADGDVRHGQHQRSGAQHHFDRDRDGKGTGKNRDHRGADKNFERTRNHQNTAARHAAPLVTQTQPVGLMGWVRRLWSLFFGATTKTK
jgi:ATP-dependent RNA helicase RhlB